jgi:hypothetical protein
MGYRDTQPDKADGAPGWRMPCAKSVGYLGPPATPMVTAARETDFALQSTVWMAF